MNHISNQEKYRLQIRKKKMQDHFNHIRKQMLFQKSHQNQQDRQFSQQNFNQINIQLVQRSLIKNNLLIEIKQKNLLKSFQEKLRHNPSIPNIQFVMSVCSNIMLDDISLQHKQEILHILLPKYITQEISPMIQTYFYLNLIIGGYRSYDQNDCNLIQKTILPKMLQLLQIGQSINLNTINGRYSLNEIKQCIWQNVLEGLKYFFDRDYDHNSILLYKIQRNHDLLICFLNEFRKNFQILDFLSLTKLIGNITTDDVSLRSILDMRQYEILTSVCLEFLKIIVSKKQIDNDILLENLESNSKILTNYDKQNIESCLYQKLNSQLIKQLMKCLFVQEGSSQLCSHFKFWQAILPLKQDEQIFYQVIDRGLDLLKQTNTKKGLIVSILNFMKTAIIWEFKNGYQRYMKFILDHSGRQIIQNIESNQQNIEICQIIQEIHNYLDMVS